MMNTPPTITEGGPELFDAVAPLWESLRTHHHGITRDFKERFDGMTWTDRKNGLLEKSGPEGLRIFLVHEGKTPIGYCIVSVDELGHGELDSLFIDESCRGKKIGEELARKGLDWLMTFPAKDIIIQVAVGNERALPFYQKLGFLPYTTLLRKKQRKL
ncbi:MAG: GNAT family N-acetyltransferase [Fibrobacterota bacterium]